MKNNKVLFSIFLVVFIDLLGFSLILPLLPYYAESFGATPAVTGLLVASYAAAQMFSAPLLGRLSDRFGRRPVLMASIFGSLIGFLLLGWAGSLVMLFLARVVDGVTGGNISVAQAYITDVTDAKNRAKGLGMIGAAFGLGFIIGPAVGGILSQWGYAVPAFAAAGLALLNLGAVAVWLPESLTPERREQIKQSKRPAISLRAMTAALRRPLVGPLLHTRFFYSLGFAVFQNIFTLYAAIRFGLDARSTGYILAYVGVLSVFTQGFLVGKLTGQFEEKALILAGTGLMAAALIAWAFAPSVPVLLVILLPLSLSGGVLNTVINSAVTQSVPPVETGGILGLSASIESLTRVIAPSLGGILLERLGTSAPGIFSGVLLALLFQYILRHVTVKSAGPAREAVSGD